MKFCLAKEHTDFFSKNGILEIDSLIRDSQLSLIQESIVSTLEKRDQNQSHKGFKRHQPNFYLLGRDLWREDEAVKKILFSKKISEIAYELGFKPPFRIGFDQFIPSNFSSDSCLNLEDSSPFQGTVFGYILCLKGKEETEKEKSYQEEEKAPSPFPLKAGNIIFFGADFPIDFKLLKENKECDYLLVSFISEKAIYSYKEGIEHLHYLKQFGYVFGDKIHENTHPIIFRK